MSSIQQSSFQRTAEGFTLVELMVTVAVLAILTTLAIPSFTTLINSNQLVSQANELVAVMQGARSEAIRRNTRVYLCSSSDGATCASSDTWTGWLMFADRDGNATPAAAEILQAGVVKNGLRVTSAAGITNGLLHFRADGLARGNANTLLASSISVCKATTRPAENVRRVNIAAGSRFSIEKINAQGACS